MKRTATTIAIFALAACGGSSTPSSEPAPATTTEPAATAVEVEAPEAPAAAETSADAAPAFTLTDLKGTEHSLADYQGKTVVLEWFNPGCPYVKYAHETGPLAAQPAAATASDDVVWLAINSNAPGKQGSGAEANQSAAAKWKMSYPLLLDEDGQVGQAYGAKSTPHMYVIDPAGNIVYRGAIDNAPMGKSEGEYVNYVEAALADLAAGRPVAVAQTDSYGCSVKYAE